MKHKVIQKKDVMLMIYSNKEKVKVKTKTKLIE